MRARPVFALSLAAILLAGCDLFGLDAAQAITEKREADGKAIGGACRHAGRAIEDCFALNRKADRAALFAGWREMNDYMRENKIEPVPPQIGPAVAATEAADKAVEPPAAESKKPAAKPTTKKPAAKADH